VMMPAVWGIAACQGHTMLRRPNRHQNAPLTVVPSGGQIM
jgi:hypothetical protein